MRTLRAVRNGGFFRSNFERPQQLKALWHSFTIHLWCSDQYPCDETPARCHSRGPSYLCRLYKHRGLRSLPSRSLQWMVEVCSCIWTGVNLRTGHVFTWQSSLFIKPSPSVLYPAGVDHSLLAALASFTKDNTSLAPALKTQTIKTPHSVLHDSGSLVQGLSWAVCLFTKY